jgi:hypothetical protein
MALFGIEYGNIPGLDAALETLESDIIWGDVNFTKSFIWGIQLAGTSRDAGNTPTTELRPGMILGITNATKIAAPFNNGGAGGLEKAKGILIYTHNTQKNNADENRIALIAVGGCIKASKIFEPGDPVGLTNATNEAAIRADMAGVFFLDDQPFV